MSKWVEVSTDQPLRSRKLKSIPIKASWQEGQHRLNSPSHQPMLNRLEYFGKAAEIFRDIWKDN